MVVTQFAVVTFFFDLLEILGRDLLNVAVIVIDSIQKRIKGGTEIKAAATAVADVEDTKRFFLKLGASPARGNQLKAFHGNFLVYSDKEGIG